MGEYTTEELQSIFIMQGFSGLSLFSVLLLMSLGLALIFGQMGVINMALGAYTVYFCSHLTKTYAPSFGPYYFVAAIGLAFVVCAALGALVEWLMIRHLYH